jgi:hypothetical protein
MAFSVIDAVSVAATMHSPFSSRQSSEPNNAQLRQPVGLDGATACSDAVP